jgi:hypothetical protein
MASRYLGPSATFIFAGKEYHPGDSMPIGAADRKHHEQFGHQWSDSPEPANVIPATMAAPLLAPAVTMPAPAEHAADAKS